MDLGYRHRFGLRFALLTLGLILITAFVVHSLPGAASVSDVGEPDPGAGTAAARHDVRTGLALGLLLSVVGAAAVYTYCQLLLRPVDDLGQALASILDCDLSSSDEEEDAQDYESTLGGAGTGDDNVDAAKKPSDRPPDGDSGLDGTVRRLERAGIDVRTTVRHLKHREQGRSGEDMRERAIAQALLHGTTDAVITVDERGIIRSFDAMAETMFGHKAEDVIGRNVGCLMPAPEAEKHDAYLHAYRRTGKRRMIGQEREVTALRADYTTFPIRIAVSELEVHGNRVFAAVMRDITERKRSENALEASEARMRAILDTAADGIITADEWGTIESFNAAAEQMFGYRAWEMIGKYIGELMAPSPNGSGDRAAAENGGRLAANPDETGADPNEEGADSASGSLSPNGFRNMVGQKQDAFGVRRDGSRFPMELAVSEVEVGEERVLTAIVRDVTERSEVEGVLARRAEELQRRNEELAQFAYVASHDLQEPLRMVSSYTQLLERRYKGQLDEDADEFISYAVDGANRMQRLLRALLAYSRIGTKGQAFQPTDCEAVWDRVMANLEAAIDESQAVVTHEHLPTVTADASQLDQLLQNLISNAIKFRGADSPRVHVTAERFRGAWKFSVADNGIGIEPDYHERVFVIFQRLHTKDEYPGTGIGLAICKKIVERHGGRIWVESKPGEGSVFHFTLPDNPGMGTETDPANIAIDSSSRPQLKADVEQPHASSHASRESATRASHSSAEEPVALPTPSALSMALAARRDKDDEREYD